MFVCSVCGEAFDHDDPWRLGDKVFCCEGCMIANAEQEPYHQYHPRLGPVESHIQPDTCQLCLGGRVKCKGQLWDLFFEKNGKGVWAKKARRNNVTVQVSGRE